MPKVFPHPDLKNEYLKGIGAEGAEVSEAEAADLVRRGLAVKSEPRATGGRVKPGGAYIVGESGPEVLEIKEPIEKPEASASPQE